MFSIFNRRLFKSHAQQWQMPESPHLDNQLYPLQWQHNTFESAYELIAHIMQNPQPDNAAQQVQFSQLLYQQNAYQDWINFTVFGRYIQRSFRAFYQQTEDAFNTEMPELLKLELMRHAQRLPLDQVLLVGGQIPASVRQDKLIISTLNPFRALAEAIRKSHQPTSKQIRASQTGAKTASTIIINLMTATSNTVKVFAVSHNQRTRDAVRNEVMILDFNRLTLSKEETLSHNAKPDTLYLIRHYSLS